MSVAAAILAAGRGSRFAGQTPKPLARVVGRPLVAWAVDAAIGAGLAPVLVVVGRRRRQVARVLPEGVAVVRARRWRRGIAHSLGAAIDALDADRSVEALCVGLADQPLVGGGAYRRLADAHARGAHFAVATYDGQRANPVLLDRTMWEAARTLRGDTGARALMGTHPVTDVDCTDTGSPIDVDTLDDLTQIEHMQIERAERGEKEPDADH